MEKHTESPEKFIREYPNPLAYAVQRYQSTRRDDYEGLQRSLVDLFEAFVRFVTIVQLQSIRLESNNILQLLPQGQNSLEFLKRPGTGNWVGLLRDMNSLEVDFDKGSCADMVKQWISSNDPKTRDCIRALREIPDLRINKRSAMPLMEICNALVTFRNKHFAHSARANAKDLEFRLPILENAIFHLYETAEFLLELRFVYVEKVERQKGEGFLLHALELKGLSEKFGQLEAIGDVEPENLYMLTNEPGEMKRGILQLTPFIVWQYNRDSNRQECYFYNDARRTSLEYLSYASGSFYYHRELHKDFENLINLRIKEVLELHPYQDLTPEERSEKSEHFFKCAKVFEEEGKYEDALEYLELCVECERRADAFYRMSILQEVLGDDSETVQESLRNALTVDPLHKDAARRLNGESDQEPERQLVDPLIPRHPNGFTAIIPAKWRNHDAAVASAFLFLCWAFSCAVNVWFGWYEDIVMFTGSYIFCSIATINGFVGRSLILKLRNHLSLQTTERSERFNEWFDQRIETIFGAFTFRPDGRVDWRDSWRRQKKLYLPVFLLMVVWFCGWHALMYESSDSIGLLIKRSADIAICLFYAMLTIRYVFGITDLFLQFSKKSLKPVFFNSGNSGLRALTPLYLLCVTSVLIGTLSLWGTALYVQKGSFYLDVVLHIIFLIMAFVWTLGIPFFIRASAVNARTTSMMRYSDHLHDAWRGFLDAPSEQERLADFERLMKNQKVFKRLPSWPLSVLETFFAVGICNIILLCVGLIYIPIRMGLEPQYLIWLENLLRI